MASPPTLASVLPTKLYSSAVGGRTRVADLLKSGVSAIGQSVTVCGWVRTRREQGKKICFVEINDGSCHASVQVVLTDNSKGFSEAVDRAATGASVRVNGLCVESPAKGQSVEISVPEGVKGMEFSIIGDVDAASYPLSKKTHSREFLREIAHLRPRSNLIGAVARVRASMCQAVHGFFKDRNFLYVHTPIVTGADCEGAGEMFQVTTLMSGIDKGEKIDYKNDFFGKPSYLTVSGQLNVESYCCALSDVYTFGPTFRAENSHTSRHLAEFWMIEPEMAFADINDDMRCAEDFLKHCINWALKDDILDLQFFDKFVDKNGLIARLQDIVSEPFGKMTYTEAIEILLRDQNAGKVKFVNQKIHWGIDMDSEHERYLVEQVTGRPTIVYNYPKDIKSFYMRQNDDGKTVAAMDILVPGIGEVIGGSQREERLDRLEARMTELKMDVASYWWYNDLRKHGSVPHCGFGLGFERLMMLVTGVENIRDVIPFPRYPGHSEF
jgi:asparaginyl-tRNA synthetase